jgi:hypothetical protein
MLTTTTTARPCATRRAATIAQARERIALDDAHHRLDAALGDLRGLVSHEGLGCDDASDLAAKYVERYLRRVAALEERGALACRPDEWQRFVAIAAKRTAAGQDVSARRRRARNELAARQCRVVATGRIRDPFLAAIVAPDPDAEILEIRAELAAAQLL